MFPLGPEATLQLCPGLAASEPCRRRDLAIRHVLAMGFWTGAGAVHERARTNLGSAGEDPNESTEKDVGEFAVEVALAEAGRGKDRLAEQILVGWLLCWRGLSFLQGLAYLGATQFTMTPLESTGDKEAICLITKIASSFETL